MIGLMLLQLIPTFGLNGGPFLVTVDAGRSLDSLVMVLALIGVFHAVTQMQSGSQAVLMLYDKRRTLCISSQAGCGMGCTFCATALGGLERNLTAGEIVAQVLYFARYLGRLDAETEGIVMDVERPSITCPLDHS